MTKFHHTQTKAIIAAGFEPSIEGETFVATRAADGMRITDTDAKAVVVAAQNAPAPKAKRTGSIVPKTWKAKADEYDSNGDAVAVALRSRVFTGTNVDLAALGRVMRENGLPMPTSGNPGQIRMSAGNRIRGALRRGQEIRIIDITILPTMANAAKREAKTAR